MRRGGRSRSAASAALLLATAVAAVPVSAAVAAPAVAAPAEAAFVPGTGASSASVARVTMRASGLGVGIGLGQARTRFAGAQGNAEARSVDMGLLSTLSKAPIACGVAPESLFPEGSIPKGVVVSSGGGPAEAHTASAGAGTPVELGAERGAAQPNSKADASVEGTRIDLAGIVTVVGGMAQSAAELTPGRQRTASATSTLGRLTLGGGQVVLDGLRWTAIHRTGASDEVAGGFSVGGMTVAGQAYETSGAEDFASALEAANVALAATGLSLLPPQTEASEHAVTVGPLRLRISATPQLRAVLGPALETVQPLRSQLLDLATPFSAGEGCGLATALGFGYLVADLALIALGDSGSIDLDLGGVRAGTQAVSYANPFAVGDTTNIALGDALGAVPPGLPPGSAFGPPTGSPSAGLPAPAGSLGTAHNPTLTSAVPTLDISPIAQGCRSTHADGDGCAGRHGELAAALIVGLIVVLIIADRVRARMS